MFSRKCPRCGSKLEATGYSAPYPSYRCRSCIKSNADKKKIKELEARLAQLENASDGNL